MNWIKETVLPKFKAFVKTKEPEKVLWIKCKSSFKGKKIWKYYYWIDDR